MDTCGNEERLDGFFGGAVGGGEELFVDEAGEGARGVDAQGLSGAGMAVELGLEVVAGGGVDGEGIIRRGVEESRRGQEGGGCEELAAGGHGRLRSF